MSVLYESWSEAGGDWTKSKIYLQCTSTDKTQKMGVREWMTRRELEQRFGEAGAEAIIIRKEESEELRKNEVRDHPEAPECQEMRQYLTLNMDKVVDSNETIISRLYKAVEESSSSSASSSSSSGSSSSSDKKKKKKSKKGTKSKKAKGAGKSKKAGIMVVWADTCCVENHELHEMSLTTHASTPQKGYS